MKKKKKFNVIWVVVLFLIAKLIGYKPKLIKKLPNTVAIDISQFTYLVAGVEYQELVPNIIAFCEEYINKKTNINSTNTSSNTSINIKNNYFFVI